MILLPSLCVLCFDIQAFDYTTMYSVLWLSFLLCFIVIYIILLRSVY